MRFGVPSFEGSEITKCYLYAFNTSTEGLRVWGLLRAGVLYVLCSIFPDAKGYGVLADSLAAALNLKGVDLPDDPAEAHIKYVKLRHQRCRVKGGFKGRPSLKCEVAQSGRQAFPGTPRPSRAFQGLPGPCKA